MSENKYCRLCFDKNAELTSINEEIKEIFYSLTSVHLIKSDIHPNFICIECDKKLKLTRKYINTLAENELRLISELHSQQDPVIVNSITFVDGGQSSTLLPEVKIEEDTDDWNESVVNEWKKNQDDDYDDRSSSEEEEVKVEKKKIRVKKAKVKKAKKEKKAGRPRCKKREPDEFDVEIENMEITSDGKVTCKYCQKQILKVYYRQHAERLHLGIHNFVCDLCSKKFYRKSSILCHMHIHLNIQPYDCPKKCGKAFYSKTAMRLHTKFHHTKHSEYICEICAMKYKQRYLLLEHIAAKHAGVRFKCTYENCNNEYHSQSALKKHVDSIHESVLVACEYCGDKFRTGFSLYQHKRLNHSGRRYPCEYEGCGKTFATPSKLKTHTKIHTGTKDFICHICNASYHIKRNLGRHIQVVHKKSRFYCEIQGCNASLCNKDNYRAHMRKVHANLPPGEMDKMLEGIAKMKPVFLDNDDDEFEDDVVNAI